MPRFTRDFGASVVSRGFETYPNVGRVAERIRQIVLKSGSPPVRARQRQRRDERLRAKCDDMRAKQAERQHKRKHDRAAHITLQ